MSPPGRDNPPGGGAVHLRGCESVFSSQTPHIHNTHTTSRTCERPDHHSGFSGHQPRGSTRDSRTAVGGNKWEAAATTTPLPSPSRIGSGGMLRVPLQGAEPDG